MYTHTYTAMHYNKIYVWNYSICCLGAGFIGQKEGEDSAPLMILEYMQYGDLHGFLVNNR